MLLSQVMIIMINEVRKIKTDRSYKTTTRTNVWTNAASSSASSLSLSPVSVDVSGRVSQLHTVKQNVSLIIDQQSFQEKDEESN